MQDSGTNYGSYLWLRAAFLPAKMGRGTRSTSHRPLARRFGSRARPYRTKRDTSLGPFLRLWNVMKGTSSSGTFNWNCEIWSAATSLARSPQPANATTSSFFSCRARCLHQFPNMIRRQRRSRRIFYFPLKFVVEAAGRVHRGDPPPDQMLIPRVDDAPHTLESLGAVFAFSSLIQPVECCIARVNGFVGWILLISLNRCKGSSVPFASR